MYSFSYKHIRNTAYLANQDEPCWLPEGATAGDAINARNTTTGEGVLSAHTGCPYSALPTELFPVSADAGTAPGSLAKGPFEESPDPVPGIDLLG